MCVLSQEFFEKLRASEAKKHAQWKKTHSFLRYLAEVRENFLRTKICYPTVNMKYSAHVFLPESAKGTSELTQKGTIHFKRPYSFPNPNCQIITCQHFFCTINLDHVNQSINLNIKALSHVGSCIAERMLNTWTVIVLNALYVLYC